MGQNNMCEFLRKSSFSKLCTIQKQTIHCWMPAKIVFLVDGVLAIQVALGYLATGKSSRGYPFKLKKQCCNPYLHQNLFTHESH